jgi:hypothetical protein
MRTSFITRALCGLSVAVASAMLPLSDLASTSTPITTPAAHDLAAPIVGGATTPSGNGWWEVGSDGGIFTFGDAQYLGSTGAMHLNQPIVGMASTPSGHGYWLVARDGGIFTFGDAGYFGSTGAIALNQPIVGMASTRSGNGYWLVARDGGIFAFGDAHYYGSTGGIRLNQPIVGMGARPTSNGYWLVAADGGVFNFGATGFYGSAAATGLSAPAVAIVSSSTGRGYWISASDGSVESFGDASTENSVSDLTAAVVGAARAVGGALRVIVADTTSALLNNGQVTLSQAALTSVSNSFSYLATNDNGSPVRWNPCQSIHYVTNLAEGPAGALSVVQEAVARLSAATGVPWVYDGTTSEIPTAERPPVQSQYGSGWAPVEIAWAQPSQTDLLAVGDYLGEGGSWWVEPGNGVKVYITGAVAINADNTANLAASFGAGTTLGKLLLHELGHVMGLGHTQDASQVMYPTLLPAQSAVSYGAGDLTGLHALGSSAGCLTEPTP